MIKRNQLLEKKVMPELIEFIIASVNRISPPITKAASVLKIRHCIDYIYAGSPSDKKNRIFLTCIYNKIGDEMFSPNFFRYTLIAFRNKKFVSTIPAQINVSTYKNYVGVLYNKLYNSYLESIGKKPGHIKDITPSMVLATTPILGVDTDVINDLQEPPINDFPEEPTTNNNKYKTTNDMELTPKQIKAKKRSKTIFTVIAIIVLLIITFFALKKFKILKFK